MVFNDFLGDPCTVAGFRPSPRIVVFPPGQRCMIRGMGPFKGFTGDFLLRGDDGEEGFGTAILDFHGDIVAKMGMDSVPGSFKSQYQCVRQ